MFGLLVTLGVGLVVVVGVVNWRIWWKGADARARADREREAQRPCCRCGRVFYDYGGRGYCLVCETPEETRAWCEQMERARQIQAYEESR